MTIYSKRQFLKYILFFFALCIGIFTIYYTDMLVEELKQEERKKIELWAEATRKLAVADIAFENLDFLLQVVQNNQNIPVILADQNDNIISYRNFDSSQIENDRQFLRNELMLMKSKNKPIEVSLYSGGINYIYYKDSLILRQLVYYPYIQLTVVLLFILIAYTAFSSSRKAEQNQVWVGLSKETAHQLGTPTSSLMAWLELFKEKHKDPELTIEIEKDIRRLEIITARFSNIGSKPVLKEINVCDIINNSVNYLRYRISSKIEISVNLPLTNVYLPINEPLFEWVLENICKNAVDAMGTEGKLSINLGGSLKKLFIDISDTGKGIPRSKQKTIFKPGYTTKSRGWGLGLSLAKRIIEEYHHGKIFVLNSELGKGSTFRIELKK